MIKILIWGLILYIAYVLYKLLSDNKIIGRSTTRKNVNEDAFSEINIRDAEYEDVDVDVDVDVDAEEES
ncbi:MAG: hypothetical protein V3U16_04080 [Candidatus Neomarinimicrobiota bacterium]